MTRPQVRQIIDNNIHDLITAVSSEDDSAIYPVDKLDAHVNNIRHAAVSIFVFRGGCKSASDGLHDNDRKEVRDSTRLLLQRRARTKYHSGGLWANTVCSHPRWQESYKSCAGRRLEEELGWSVPIEKFGEISYQARVGELYENELVHCFYGWFDERIDVQQYNRDEVCSVQWLTIPETLEQIETRPESFTEWFKIYMTEHREMIDALVNEPAMA